MKHKLPHLDLPRYSGPHHYIDRDFNVSAAFENFHHSFSERTYGNSSVDDLFCRRHSQEDAKYRQEFLAEWLQHNATRKEMETVYQSLPAASLRFVHMKDERGEDRSASAIKQQISAVQKYLFLPKTIEQIEQNPGQSAAARDLRRFAQAYRGMLN